VKNLAPLKILVTRPAQQAADLVAAIQAYGGTAIPFPSLEITAIAKENFLKHIKKINEYDFVIFLSPHAVFKTAEFIRTICPNWPMQTKIIAIGSGTASALKQEDLPVDYLPEKNFSSEGLLKLCPLRNPNQKKILILQGEKGRGYLDKELEKKGACITAVNVYTRRRPRIAKKCIPDPHAVNIIICTSNTGLKNLLTSLHPYWHTKLFDKQLLVVSQRIADYAEKLGFVKPAIISDNAGNAAILQALWTCDKERF
jgi:uroporphyrinogen-III synthase